jgi:hypothetical protein
MKKVVVCRESTELDAFMREFSIASFFHVTALLKKVRSRPELSAGEPPGRSIQRFTTDFLI